MMNRFLQDIRLGGQQVITPVEGGELHINNYKHIISYILRQHQLLTPKYPNLKYIWSNQKMDTKGVDEKNEPILKD